MDNTETTGRNGENQSADAGKPSAPLEEKNRGGVRNLIWGILSLPCAAIFALFEAVFLRGLHKKS